jgi:hypothetical protein
MSGEIVFIAPYPDQRLPIEGWYSRIRTIDSLFADQPRSYVSFADHHRPGPDDEPVYPAPGVRQFNLNAKEPQHVEIFSELFRNANLVYCHTMHNAIDILPWFPCDKIVVDNHGIAPEEEELQGHHERAVVFGDVERKVLDQASKLVVVTRTMESHLRLKHPATSAQFIVLPIVERYDHTREDRWRGPDWEPARVIYAGATQPWQNVDAMLRLAESCDDFADILFISHEPDVFARRAAELGVPSSRFNLGSARKHEMPRIYATRNFGLVLRDDIAVNRVACPTKLSEYMDFGIVPVVRSPALGDFLEEGYRFVTEEEVRCGLIPDRRTQAEMRAANYAVIERIADQFAAAAGVVQGLAEL